MILLRCIWHFSLKIAEAFVSISRMCNQFVKSCELEPTLVTEILSDPKASHATFIVLSYARCNQCDDSVICKDTVFYNYFHL